MYLNLDKYQVFATLLEQLRGDISTTHISATELQQGLASLQQFFRQQIVPLTDLDSRVESYQTEISKQLRLLEIDINFFQGARQPATAQGRLRTISDRLAILIQYCGAVVQGE